MYSLWGDRKWDTIRFVIITWKALLRFWALLWFGNIIVILLIWWMVLPSLSHFYGPFTCVERHMVCNSFSLLHWFQNFPLSPLQYIPLGCLPILLLFPVNRKIVYYPCLMLFPVNFKFKKCPTLLYKITDTWKVFNCLLNCPNGGILSKATHTTFISKELLM